MPNDHLEPRVAKVETAIEAITRDINALVSNVRDLTSAVRTQGDQTDAQIRNLLVSVTAAAGPRKTDWALLIGAIGLILAIGAAAFSPMLLRINDLYTKQDKTEERMREHELLRLHPVGESRLNAIEEAMKTAVGINPQGIRDLDNKLQREFNLATKNVIEKVDALRTVVEEIRINGSPITRERLSTLETQIKGLEKRSDGK